MFDPIEELQKIQPAMRPLLKVGINPCWFVKLWRRCLAAKSYGGTLVHQDNDLLFSTYDAELAGVTRLFQQGNGLVADGEAGPVTFARMAGEAPAATRFVADKPDAQSLQIRRSIVHVARYACDVLRIREAGGPNAGPEVEMILEHAGGRRGMPWCAGFVFACVDYGHILLGLFTPNVPLAPGIPELSCSAIYRWAKAENRLRDLSTARAGDAYLFAGGNTGYRHVGLIEEKLDDGTLQTIEGNTSADPKTISQDADGDGVYRRHRDPEQTPGAVVSVS